MEIVEFKEKDDLSLFHDRVPTEVSKDFKLLEYNLKNYFGTAAIKSGKDLSEYQEKYSNYDKTKGFFLEWLNSSGLPHTTAYRMISCYKYSLSGKMDIEEFQSLPKSLQYAVSAAEVPPEIKTAIENKDITSNKELQELKARLKAEQAEKEKLNKELSESKQALDFALSAPPKLVEKEVILENPKHLQTIQELQKANQKAESQLYNLSIEKDKLEKDLKLYKAIDGEYDKKQKEIRDMQIKIKEVEFLTQKSAKELQAITSLDNFVKKTDLFLKDNLLEMSFAELKDNPLLNQTKSEAVKRFQMLIDWIKFCSNKLGVEL